MTAISRELDAKLKTLDPRAARSLERLVRDALALVEVQTGSNSIASDDRFPPDFFKKIAEEFGPEPFERPPQGESEQRDAW